MRCLLSILRSAGVGLLVPLITARSLRAQAGEDPKRSAAECYGFAFGKWTPPLDWQLSGHGARLDSARVPRAPNGRGWAASDVETRADSSLLLFPPWWPAGVLIEFKSKPMTLADTVTGKATAFVADARKQPSTSSIRGWLVPCQSH